MTIKVKKLHPDAVLPTFAHPGEDACADLYCVENVRLIAGQPQYVKTGISIEVPTGYEALVRPRSGIFKGAVSVHLGTIDSGFRGELCVGMLFHGDLRYQEHAACFPAGSRIAQLAVRPLPNIEFEWADELSESARGANGFGSTGTSDAIRRHDARMKEAKR